MEDAACTLAEQVGERGSEAVERGGEYGDQGAFGLFEHGRCIVEGSGEGFIHEHGFSEWQERPELCGMFSSIDGMDDEGIDLLGHGVEGGMEANAVKVHQLRFEG